MSIYACSTELLVYSVVIDTIMSLLPLSSPLKAIIISANNYGEITSLYARA